MKAAVRLGVRIVAVELVDSDPHGTSSIIATEFELPLPAESGHIPSRLWLNLRNRGVFEFTSIESDMAIHSFRSENGKELGITDEYVSFLVECKFDVELIVP